MNLAHFVHLAQVPREIPEKSTMFCVKLRKLATLATVPVARVHVTTVRHFGPYRDVVGNR